MTANDEALPWVNFAEEDYAMASLSLRRKTPLTNGACFHAQQCVEKYLKAILVYQQRPFPRTHDLRLLSNLCTQSGVLVEIDEEVLDLLSSYALRARYPGDVPTLEEGHDALRITRIMRRFARKWLGIL
jgi:HEPN domain-containing protein